MRVMDAIKRIEGTPKGDESILGPAKKIIDVRRDSKKRITGYIVEELGLLSAVETVKGILSGEIDDDPVKSAELGRRADQGPRWLIKFGGEDFESFSFSPDGKRLAVSFLRGKEGWIGVADIEGSEAPRLCYAPLDSTSVRFSPDGKSLVKPALVG